MGFTVKLKKFKKRGKQNLFVIPYFFTFANAIFGLLSVIQSLEGNFINAAYCIILAAIMDLFDGKLARALSSTSCLGMELDSLCDAVSFCFAPVILLYSVYFKQLGIIGILVLSLYLCCGLLRLAKFNIISSTETKDISYFVGLPTTVSAFLIAQFVINFKWISIIFLPFLQKPFSLALFVAAIAVLMISPVRFSSFKMIHPKILVFISLLVSGFSILGFMCGLPIVFLGIFFYILIFVSYFLINKLIGFI